MWFDKLLTTLRGLEGRIISFIDQPEVIKKILESLLTAAGGKCPSLPASQAQVDIPAHHRIVSG